MNINELEFETHSFHGQTRYHCPFCKFDTYTKNGVVDHIAKSHANEISPPVKESLIVDSKGQKVGIVENEPWEQSLEELSTDCWGDTHS